MDWQDIELVGKPTFKDIDKSAGGLNIYEWKLSRDPEWEWDDRFKKEASLSASFHAPTRVRSTVTLRVPEGELETYAKQLMSWVRNTNTKFKSVDLPEIARLAEAKKKQQESHEDRLRRAREEAENLDLGDL